MLLKEALHRWLKGLPRGLDTPGIYIRPVRFSMDSRKPVFSSVGMEPPMNMVTG
jgi:hypothetical protein